VLWTTRSRSRWCSVRPPGAGSGQRRPRLLEGCSAQGANV
jgi:hypothetical protein